MIEEGSPLFQANRGLGLTTEATAHSFTGENNVSLRLPGTDDDAFDYIRVGRFYEVARTVCGLC